MRSSGNSSQRCLLSILCIILLITCANFLAWPTLMVNEMLMAPSPPESIRSTMSANCKGYCFKGYACFFDEPEDSCRRGRREWEKDAARFCLELFPDIANQTQVDGVFNQVDEQRAVKDPDSTAMTVKIVFIILRVVAIVLWGLFVNPLLCALAALVHCFMAVVNWGCILAITWMACSSAVLLYFEIWVLVSCFWTMALARPKLSLCFLSATAALVSVGLLLKCGEWIGIVIGVLFFCGAVCIKLKPCLLDFTKAMAPSCAACLIPCIEIKEKDRRWCRLQLFKAFVSACALLGCGFLQSGSVPSTVYQVVAPARLLHSAILCWLHWPFLKCCIDQEQSDNNGDDFENTERPTPASAQLVAGSEEEFVSFASSVLALDIPLNLVTSIVPLTWDVFGGPCTIPGRWIKVAIMGMSLCLFFLSLKDAITLRHIKESMGY